MDLQKVHKSTYDFLNLEAKKCLTALSLASNEEEKQKAISQLRGIQGRIKRELNDLSKYDEQYKQ